MNTAPRYLTLTLMSLLLTAGAVSLAPTAAHAFCGFYVGGAGVNLYNNATQVVLMRDGTRTVLSMQNNYQGPLDDFAMVVPVPVVLMEDHVKTLDKTIFDKVDQLSAPRLVEYWELDPCDPGFDDRFDSAAGGPPQADNGGPDENGVVVEAEFKVGEYEIVILSASESTGLDTWLRTNDYNIPEGAEQTLRPYVDGGMYFFVARIIADEVRYEDGRAILSPLRFHYDTDTFQLPIRLGLLSAQEQQDLLVYILARGQRYEMANYPNVTIPTNINVLDAVRNDFGAFYNELFERTLEVNPGAVVTEYAWDASTCDPCPGPTLDANDIATLGADVVAGAGEPQEWGSGWVLTRLHARYGADDIGEDLVFQAAEAIAGGREFITDDGELEEGAVPYQFNNFQGRYAIRHAWEGEVACDDPQYGRWGGPPGQEWDFSGNPAPASSPNTSGEDYRTQEAALEELVAEAIPELGVVPGQRPAGGDGETIAGDANGTSSGDSGCATAPGSTDAPIALLAILAFVVAWRRR